MSTLDLVTAIINKDATGIETAFNNAMAEKISTRLDDMRTDVAQTMFASEEVVSEDVNCISEEEYLNLSEEEKESYEPISEEQLDEISQELSQRYADKVLNKADRKEFPTKDSRRNLPKYVRKEIIHNKLPTNRKQGVSRAYNRIAAYDYYNSTAHKDPTVKKIRD